ncbi:MAG: NADH-quinone oxidoreductase subunit C [Burkholderiales bacterium]|nr:NADH-quinone oxidoreductase subunit C [Burkholderiales bacterium]OJX05779.1 MAG: hydrogenase [Burkholderiales bacterium 70-64]
MRSIGLDVAFEPLPAPLPIARARVRRSDWQAAARTVAAAGGRLVALWASDRSGTAGGGNGGGEGERSGGIVACAAYAVPEGLAWLELVLESEPPACPDLAAVFPCAGRMQRAMTDLAGVTIEGAADTRRWLDHGVWPAGCRPLRHDTPLPHDGPARRDGPARSDAPAPPSSSAPPGETLPADYPFVRVEGDGVHEIAVGPVHAGIIEPGHFRFSAVGEKVLRLEERLGYVHKGIERRFTQIATLEAHRLAGRVSGDSTVAFAWACCMALETAADAAIPARAQWLRALMLERERVANHLGDLGAIANDAGFAFGLAQFSRLREDWQRLSREAFGHRFMMDRVAPGGVSADVGAVQLDRMRAQCDAIEREVAALRAVYDEHAGLQDRFMGAGRVTPQLAARLGLTGLAGRASGRRADLRCDHPGPPYDRLAVTMAAGTGGDVAARVLVRFEETSESLRLIRALCAGMPGGPVRGEIRLPPREAVGAGWVEGWRGEVFVALELDAGGCIRRCHCHDPSWQNWPVLEHAVMGNIVPDFPLINKSFNLSYSGHDL